MQQVERNRCKVQTLSTRQKKKRDKQKTRNKKEEVGSSSSGGSGATATSSDLDLHPEYIQNLMMLLDPTEFLVTNSMHTFGRACTVSTHFIFQVFWLRATIILFSIHVSISHISYSTSWCTHYLYSFYFFC